MFRCALISTFRVVALGSDWFVTEPSPLQGIHAAVSRRVEGFGRDGCVPAEKVSIEDGLVGYTSAAAYAAREEDRRGFMRVGYLADLVVLDRWLLDVEDVDELVDGSVQVLVTMVDGEVVYAKEGVLGTESGAADAIRSVKGAGLRFEQTTHLN